MTDCVNRKVLAAIDVVSTESHKSDGARQLQDIERNGFRVKKVRLETSSSEEIQDNMSLGWVDDSRMIKGTIGGSLRFESPMAKVMTGGVESIISSRGVDKQTLQSNMEALCKTHDVTNRSDKKMIYSMLEFINRIELSKLDKPISLYCGFTINDNTEHLLDVGNVFTLNSPVSTSSNPRTAMTFAWGTKDDLRYWEEYVRNPSGDVTKDNIKVMKQSRVTGGNDYILVFNLKEGQSAMSSVATGVRVKYRADKTIDFGVGPKNHANLLGRELEYILPLKHSYIVTSVDTQKKVITLEEV